MDNIYNVILGATILVQNGTEKQVRQALADPHVTLAECNVYCSTDIFELPMNGVEWLLDNPTPTYTIRRRKRIEANTDPQRRCYNGYHFSSELQWTAWDTLELEVAEDRIEKRLTFWRELNDYAVSQRGKSAKSEFEAVRETN